MSDFDEEELEDPEHPLLSKTDEDDDLFLGLSDDDDGIVADDELSEDDELGAAGMHVEEEEPDF